MPPSDSRSATPVEKPRASRGWFSRKSAENNATISEKQVESEPHVDNAEPEVKPVSVLQLYRFATKFELSLNAVGLLCAIAAGAAQPLMSLLFGNLVNAFVGFGIAIAKSDLPGATAEDHSAVEAAAHEFRKIASEDALYLTVIGIGFFFLTYVYMVTWIYTGEVNAKRIREAYLRAVLRQDVAFFDNVGAGEVATRIQTDTHLIQQGISEKVALAASFLGAFFTGFILAYVRSWRLALAISSILPCIAIAGGLMNKFISKYMQLSLKYVADGGSLAEEVISTIRTAQAFGSQATLSRLYDVHINKAHTVDMKSALIHGFGLGFFFFVIYSAYALAFSFGTTLILSGHADAGVVVNVFIAILIGSISLAMLAPELQAVSNAVGAAAKLFATIDRVPTIDSASDEGRRLESIQGRITLEHVDFNYPSRPNVPIVKDLSLTFEAGKTSALVGASGSGKSTAIALIERWYDPLSGTVKLDGVDIKELNVRWLRQQIGLVSQEPTLFATTIRGNVAHGLIGTKFERASDEEKFELIKDACIKANADGFISKLPLGYDTMVGERGFLLSGGQKQRIAIARAIVSDPRILLLDEATSALDTQSEGIVQNALDKAAAGRTTITIAHRLSTIKDADMIYVMGEGLVLEKGTHQQLLANPDGPYARLVNSQKLKERKSSGDDDDDDESTESHDNKAAAEKANREMEKAAADEVPLGRTSTSRSLASEILDQKNAAAAETGEKSYSLFYLFKRMGYINREDYKLYIFGVFFASIGGLVFPALGVVYAKAIEVFQLQDRRQMRREGDRNALWFFIIAIGATIAITFQNYFFARAASGLTTKLRHMSFKSILRQDIEFFDQDKNSAGSLTSQLSENPQKINGLAGITLGAIVQSIVTLIGGIIIGLVFGWKVALVAVACIPFLVSAGYIRLRVVVLKDQKNKVAHESSAQLACEAAGAIRTVASLTREKDCLDIYSASLEVPLKESNKTSLYSNAFFAFSQAASFFVIALVFWYGSRLVSTREYTTFQFFVCLMSVTFGAIQAGNVFSFVPDISSAKGAATDIINLIDTVPEIDAESTEGRVLQNVKGHIRFEDVHFRYPTRPGVRVLRGLNLTIEPGTYIALVGASGCGKSTVIQLIERFYNPLAGNVYLDGNRIDELNVQDYRKNIALVSQEPTLYAGTIKFNILLGAIKPPSEVTQEELEAVCRDANILDFIRSLPDGFETEVGGKGSQLSGGQKQRIAIARALLRNPKVLLLDEATSALDSNSERVVQDALDRAARGRTTIAIAHRLSTIQNADCIYFIKDGRVSEAGTHEELLALKGGYHEYVLLQDLSHAA